VRAAVVFHHAGVGDGDIVGALLEAGSGIAARLKKRVDQIVGLRDGGLGVVDEAGLDGVPLGYKTIPLSGFEIVDLQASTRVSRSASLFSAFREEPWVTTARSYSCRNDCGGQWFWICGVQGRRQRR